MRCIYSIERVSVCVYCERQTETLKWVKHGDASHSVTMFPALGIYLRWPNVSSGTINVDLALKGVTDVWTGVRVGF